MKRIIPVIVAIAAAALAALLFAPGPPRLGDRHTGDADLAARVRAAAGDPTGLRGLAVATVDGGRIRTAGLGADGAGRPVGADTAFEPGSVTKTWTAMLFADMVARGAVRPTDTLGTLLPGRTFADPAVRDITAEELVSHRSGLPPIAPRSGVGGVLTGFTANLRGADPYAGVGADDLLDAVAGLRLENAKGTVRYSNFGMAVLGQALAVRAGVPYDRLVTDRVLTPVGMTATVFRPDGATPPATAATGGTAAGRTVAPWTGSGYLPAGVGDWTTAADLARLVSATMAGTAPGATAAAPRFADDDTTRVGYGWFTTRYETRQITWHNGGTGGFRSYVAFDPATKRGVVVLGNTDRSVGPIALSLLGVGGTRPDLPPTQGPLQLAVTLALLLGSLGLAGTLLIGGRVGWWPPPDRLRVVAGAASGIGCLALAYALGAWLILPGLLWTVAFGGFAGALALAAIRWRTLPTIRSGRPRSRAVGTGVSVAVAVALTTAALVV